MATLEAKVTETRKLGNITIAELDNDCFVAFQPRDGSCQYSVYGKLDSPYYCTDLQSGNSSALDLDSRAAICKYISERKPQLDVAYKEVQELSLKVLEPMIEGYKTRDWGTIALPVTFPLAYIAGLPIIFAALMVEESTDHSKPAETERMPQVILRLLTGIPCLYAAGAYAAVKEAFAPSKQHYRARASALKTTPGPNSIGVTFLGEQGYGCKPESFTDVHAALPGGTRWLTHFEQKTSQIIDVQSRRGSPNFDASTHFFDPEPETYKQLCDAIERTSDLERLSEKFRKNAMVEDIRDVARQAGIDVAMSRTAEGD
ncbi:hypothetical protein HY642_01220 [Candidatus Woesearchaeota archaeon]|nr:hypothetical protein [Candidatus Woesearchaeota archaeon]